MKKISQKYLNTILAVGMFLMFLGILIFLGFFGQNEDVLWSVLSIIMSLVGVIFLYVYIGFSKTSFKLFVGLELFLNGIFLFIEAIKIFPLGLQELWPCMLVLSSISLFVASRAKGKKIHLSYDYTAILLLVLGVFFFLFSLGIIKRTFNDVMVILLPILFILSGIFLVILFLQRKSLLKMMPKNLSSELKEENFEKNESEDL